MFSFIQFNIGKMLLLLLSSFRIKMIVFLLSGMELGSMLLVCSLRMRFFQLNFLFKLLSQMERTCAWTLPQNLDLFQEFVLCDSSIDTLGRLRTLSYGSFIVCLISTATYAFLILLTKRSVLFLLLVYIGILLNFDLFLNTR